MGSRPKGIGNGVIFVSPLPMETIGRKQALKGQAGYAALVVAPDPALNQRDDVIPRLLVGEIRSVWQLYGQGTAVPLWPEDEFRQSEPH